MDFTFEENEKVLCFHGPLIYEAKVLSTDRRPDSDYYLIHYSGWKKSWDEWIPESRVLKFNQENINKQKELVENSQLNKTPKTKVSEKKPENTLEKKKRRRSSVLAEKEDEFMSRPEIKLIIPDGLKLKIVEDWESITKSQQLVSLPRKPNASEILDRFREEFKTTRRSTREVRIDDVINEVVEGLKLYFDKALGNLLLYRFERLQFHEMMTKYPDSRLCEIYGAEHLLRLFVQLPKLIAHTNMDIDAVNILKDHFSQFLVFISKHQSDFFSGDYDIATPAYISKME